MGKSTIRKFSKWMTSLLLAFCMAVGMMAFRYPVEVKAMTTQSAAVQWAANQVGSQYNEGFGVQCVALISKYCDYLGVPHIYGHAYMFTSSAIPSGWSRIAGAAVQPGDIAVWTGGYGGVGHVAIVLPDGKMIDQNGGGNEESGTIRDMYYNSGSLTYWGVIRPNFNAETPAAPVIPTIPSGGCTVADGDYQIVSAVIGNRYNPGPMCLTIGGLPIAINNNGANAELWECYGRTGHVFTVARMNDGYYKIKLKDSDNKCLDAENGGYAGGTNVWQWEDNGSDAQRWVIEEMADGNGYAIRAKHGGRCLDVANAGTTNGTNIQLYDGNGSNAQRWYFIPWGGGDSAEQELPDGEYQIVPKGDGTKALHAASDAAQDITNIDLSSCRNDKQHTFQTKWLGNGYYKIINKNSGLALDVYDALSKNAANVTLCPDNDQANQSWIIRSSGDGYYYIVSECNGKYLDLYDGKTEDGTNITVCEGHDGDNQKWRFIPCGDSIGQTLPDGEYQIAPQSDEGMRVSIAGEGDENGANVELGNGDSLKKQIFTVTYLGDDFYKIIHNNSGRSLDVYAGGMEEGTNVQLFDYHGEDSQQWILRDCGDGYYNVISNSNGLCFDLCEAPTAGANIQMWRDNGTAAQKWKFLPVIYAESIFLQKSEVRMETDFQLLLKAGFLPENTSDQTLTWESSNSEAVTVSEDMGGKALVCAVAPGTAVVTATSSNGKTASCTVTVTEEGGAHTHKYRDGYESDNYSHWKMCGCGRIAENETHTYQTEVLPATVGTDGAVTETCSVCGHNVSRKIPKIADIALSETSYESDGTAKLPVITVTDSCGTVLAEGTDYSVSYPENAASPGTYEVKIAFTGNYSGEISKGFEIIEPGTGKEADNPAAKVQKITISGVSHKIAAGKKIKLKAVAVPSNATAKAFTWKADNTKYAMVNSKGIVTVKKAGAGKTVTITAEAKDGSGTKATYKIKIMKGAVKKIAIPGKKTRTQKAGKSFSLKVKVTAQRSANKNLQWKSSNTKYATVNGKGRVTLKKAGKGKIVRITAAATDGSGKKAAVKIKIE